MNQAGLPTVSEADLDFILRPHFRTEEDLGTTKRQWIVIAEGSVPTGEIPMHRSASPYSFHPGHIIDLE
jgi:hypothetical protein